MNVDVAVADTGFDGRDQGVADDGVDQTRSPAWDHHIDQAPGLDQVGDTGMVGAGQQLHRVGREALCDQG